MAREKTKNVLFVGMGWKTETRVTPTGRIEWTLSRFKTIVKNGEAETLEEAESAAWKTFQEQAQVAATNRNRNAALRQKMKGWAQSRPYVMMYVLHSLKDKLQLSTIVNGAEEGEEDFAKLLPEDVRGTWGKKHHLAKTARVLCNDILQTLQDLGWTRERAFKWGCEYLGQAFEYPGESYTAIMKKERQKREDNDARKLEVVEQREARRSLEAV